MEGNQMKMREALENIAGYAETARCHTEDVHILSFLGEIEGWARSALSAPPRQCDVGTPKEQQERFDKMCFPLLEKGMCKNCRLYNIQGSCELAWAQMPYEAKEGGTI